jgi:hypothetical protein
MRSTLSPNWRFRGILYPRHRIACTLQGDGESVGQRRLGGHVLQVHAQMDNGLRDLRPDSANDAIGPHEARRGHGLQQMLGDQRIHGGNARDVDHRNIGARLTMASSRFCMTTCVRALSRVPINGSARTLSHKRTTGVDSSSSSCCWRAMTSSRVF